MAAPTFVRMNGRCPVPRCCGSSHGHQPFCVLHFFRLSKQLRKDLLAARTARQMTTYTRQAMAQLGVAEQTAPLAARVNERRSRIAVVE